MQLGDPEVGIPAIVSQSSKTDVQEPCIINGQNDIFEDRIPERCEFIQRAPSETDHPDKAKQGPDDDFAARTQLQPGGWAGSESSTAPEITFSIG